jgi:hypothetical protein
MQEATGASARGGRRGGDLCEGHSNWGASSGQHGEQRAKASALCTYLQCALCRM